MKKTDEATPISEDPSTGKALSLSCNGLMKVRTMWITVDPLLTPLGVRPDIQELFISEDKLKLGVVN